ncbi:uncharacterized, partial [Tachysurus ichikawai]
PPGNNPDCQSQTCRLESVHFMFRLEFASVQPPTHLTPVCGRHQIYGLVNRNKTGSSDQV